MVAFTLQWPQQMVTGTFTFTMASANGYWYIYLYSGLSNWLHLLYSGRSKWLLVHLPLQWPQQMVTGTFTFTVAAANGYWYINLYSGFSKWLPLQWPQQMVTFTFTVASAMIKILHLQSQWHQQQIVYILLFSTFL
jgi:hypothetical protein